MASPPLLRLPIELHQNIIGHLDLQDRAALAMTNRYFSVVATPTYKTFLDSEMTERAVAQNLYTCKGCARFRRAEEFANDMIKDRRGRHGQAAATRFCLDCGVGRGFYTVGTIVVIGTGLWELCRSRRTYTDRARSDYAKPIWRKIGDDIQYDCFAHEDWSVSSRIIDLHVEEIHAVGLAI